MAAPTSDALSIPNTDVVTLALCPRCGAHPARNHDICKRAGEPNHPAAPNGICVMPAQHPWCQECVDECTRGKEHRTAVAVARAIQGVFADHPRRKARTEGRMTYDGQPCGWCNNTERKTTTGRCTFCPPRKRRRHGKRAA